jgi:hypothetical protein
MAWAMRSVAREIVCSRVEEPMNEDDPPPELVDGGPGDQLDDGKVLAACRVAAQGDDELDQIVTAIVAGATKADDIAFVTGLPIGKVYQGKRRLMRRIQKNRANQEQP